MFSKYSLLVNNFLYHVRTNFIVKHVLILADAIYWHCWPINVGFRCLKCVCFLGFGYSQQNWALGTNSFRQRTFRAWNENDVTESNLLSLIALKNQLGELMAFNIYIVCKWTKLKKRSNANALLLIELQNRYSEFAPQIFWREGIKQNYFKPSDPKKCCIIS